MTETEASTSGQFEVWRQDDYGNRFKMITNVDAEEAERIRQEFEDRGHKQFYEVVDTTSCKETHPPTEQMADFKE